MITLETADGRKRRIQDDGQVEWFCPSNQTWNPLCLSKLTTPEAVDGYINFLTTSLGYVNTNDHFPHQDCPEVETPEPAAVNPPDNKPEHSGEPVH